MDMLHTVATRLTKVKRKRFESIWNLVIRSLTEIGLECLYDARRSAKLVWYARKKAPNCVQELLIVPDVRISVLRQDANASTNACVQMWYVEILRSVSTADDCFSVEARRVIRPHPLALPMDNSRRAILVLLAQVTEGLCVCTQFIFCVHISIRNSIMPRFLPAWFAPLSSC